MKHLSKILATSLIGLFFSTANAQDENHPWAISVGVNAVDFFSEKDFNALDFRDFNVLPVISKLSVGRHIKNGFFGELSGSLNRIDRLGFSTGKIPVDDFSYFSLDAALKHSFRGLIKKADWLDPQLGLGLGYFWIEDQGEFTINPSIGVDLWLKDNFAITLQSLYKGIPSEWNNEDDTFIEDGVSFQGSHIQHSVGVKFAFGGTDTDGDGVYDNKDECPEVAGLKQFNGCPDTDLDGIKDADDSCPNDFGLAKLNGCPDTDGDSIADKDDACPNVKGSVAMKGCPDSDKDGIADNLDKCPNEKGPSANGGCPYLDRDNDGILDKDDKCPEVPGVKANNGCPPEVVVKVVTAEVQKTLNQYAKTILFDTGKSTIKEQSETVLRDIVNILKEYPDARFTVEGHTDSVGSASSNQRLSESRAASVKAFLIERGVSQSELSSIGYGEVKPIASNDTNAGRKLNRRVEINLVR